MLYYEAGSLPGSLRSLSYNGRYAPLVSTAALQSSFNGSLRLPSFRVSTQPAAASSIVEVKENPFFLRYWTACYFNF